MLSACYIKKHTEQIIGIHNLSMDLYWMDYFLSYL